MKKGEAMKDDKKTTKKVAKKKVTKKVAKKKTKKKASRKVGAPEKYNKDKEQFMLYLYEQGKTDKQVSQIVGIAESTLNKWKLKYPQLKESIKSAKDATDDEVEEALLKLALGYEYEEERAISVSLGQGAGSVIEMAKETKHKPADAKSAIFWLSNRRPETWRLAKSVEVTGKNGGSLSVEHQLGGILNDIDGDTAGLGGDES